MVTREELIFDAIEREKQKPKCFTCDYYDGPYLHDEVDEEAEDFDPNDLDNYYGFCRRRPPTVIELVTQNEPGSVLHSHGSFGYGWLDLDGSDWCGDHKPRPLIPAETPDQEE